MATSKRIAVEMNGETGEVIEREWRQEEIAEAVEFTAQHEKEQKAKVAARTSALAKLAELALMTPHRVVIAQTKDDAFEHVALLCWVRLRA